MSILMISPQYRPIVGGYERAAERLSVALAARGHDITVIAERREPAWTAKEMIDGVKVRRLWCIYRRRFHMLTALTSFTMFMLKAGRRFDVWHVHQYGLRAALTVALGKLVHRPVVMKLTSSAGQGLACAVAKNRFAPLIAALLRRVSAVVALTNESAKEAHAFGIPAERIHKLGNGVETATFCRRNAVERQELKQRLGIGPQPTVIYVGRLSMEKNPEGLLEAWNKARPLMPAEWRLVMVGDGPMRGEIESIVGMQALKESVLISGPRHNIEQWLGSAEIFVISSHNEGLSNTMLEAMACGLPVVATRVSGVAELVGETGAGLVAEVGDMDGLAKAIARLAGDALLRENMGAIARKVIEHRYSIERIAEKHEILYRCLLAEDS